MAGRAEHREAFDRLEELLHTAAAAHARALTAHRGTPTGDTAERRLEHALERLARLRWHATAPNLSTTALFQAAVNGERRLEHTLEGPAAEAAARRARSLIDAARRGVRVQPPRMGPRSGTPLGVYVEPLRPELEQAFRRSREPYLRWRDGAVVVLPDEELQALRDEGDEVDVLFLDGDELLDFDAREDRPALDTVLAQRLAVSRAAPDRVGDSRARHARRMMLRQSAALRVLRDRLAGEHAAAHAALLPTLGDHRRHLEAPLAAAPPPHGAPSDPVAAAHDAERRLEAHVGSWAAEPDDPAGLRGHFRAVAQVAAPVGDR